MPAEERVERDRRLRRAVLAGDEHAWRTWYEEHFAAVRAYVLWRCGGLHDRADEVTQETWLTAVRRVRDFDPARGDFRRWLRGIAAHLLHNLFRKDQRRNGQVPTRAEPTGPPADAALEERERAERVAGALAALPDRYEAVLRARYLEGRTVEEIAAAGGQTPKTIESLLTRARQAFRALFDHGEFTDEPHP
jgi:RNA polymerase sigma-70 factor, ECF subfamily